MDTGELILCIEGQGKAMYQYVYREAAGVYWDTTLKGFKSTELKEWTPSQWYAHIVDIVLIGLGVELVLAENVSWGNVSEADKTAILAK
ncbi:hypothetical protein BH20ACI2_BH20ACI2_09010 [soil metagenome]